MKDGVNSRVQMCLLCLRESDELMAGEKGEREGKWKRLGEENWGNEF